MKKLLTILFTVLALGSYAATTVVVTTGASTNSVAQVGQTISDVTVANGSTNALTLTLFDAPTNLLTYVRGAYTNYSQYLTNFSTVFTNTGGILQTNNYTNALWTYAVSNPNATNSYKRITTIAVPASSTVVWAPVNGIATTFGILSTNDQAATVTYNMSPNF